MVIFPSKIVCAQNAAEFRLKKMWCIPPKQNADFVAKMEDILDLYSLAYDAKCPVICLDEKP